MTKQSRGVFKILNRCRMLFIGIEQQIFENVQDPLLQIFPSLRRRAAKPFTAQPLLRSVLP